MNILFIDTETTGLDPRRHSLIQISADFYADGERVDMFSCRIAQDNRYSILAFAPVSVGAYLVNGQRFQVNSPIGSTPITEPEAIKHFANFLLNLKEKYDKFNIGGHNIHFDVSFIKEAFAKQYIDDIEELIGYRYVDVASIGLALNDAGLIQLDKVNSENLAKFFSLEYAKKHDAIVDNEVTAKTYFAMKNLIKEKIAPKVAAFA
jgi:DNA polymerase III alpha subunit (gram-positive type)